MEQEIFKRKINYYLENADEKKVSVFQADINYKELYQLVQELPHIIREQTFDIILLKKDSSNEKGFTPDLSSVLHNSLISKQCFSILDFYFKKEDVADSAFFSSSLKSTDAYDVYVKWEEISELAIYLSQFLEDGRVTREIDLDLSKIAEGIRLLTFSPSEKQNLFQRILDCFQFSLVDEVTYEAIDLIRMSSCYELFDLSTQNQRFTRVFEIGKKNSATMNCNFLENNDEEKGAETGLSLSSNVTSIEQEMLKKNGAFGNIATFYQDYQELKSEYYFKCSILNDDGDLCRYRGMVDYLNLYQWLNTINNDYSIRRKERFEVIPWNCYENTPILDEYLDPSILENHRYKIVGIDLSEGKIDVRKGVATDVFIEWEEVPKLAIVVEKFLSDFLKKPEIDLSVFTETIAKMDISKGEKKQIINQLFSYFHLTLLEIIPSAIIYMIQDLSSSSFLNVKNAKSRLEKSLTFGIRNQSNFTFLEEKKIKLENQSYSSVNNAEKKV